MVCPLLTHPKRTKSKLDRISAHQQNRQRKIRGGVMVPLGMSSREIKTSGYGHPMVRLRSSSRVGSAHAKQHESGIMALYLDPETIALLRETLDDAWACLPPQQQAAMQKSTLAVRILKSAAQGERDRKRLRDAALMDLAA
jgi:hypothetical protein